MELAVPNATVKRDARGFFAIDSGERWADESDTFVLPKQFEQVLNTSCYLHALICFKFMESI